MSETAERDIEDGFVHFRTALDAHLAIGDRLGAGGALGYMARAATAAGNHAQAVLLNEESLSIHRRIGEQFGQTLNLNDQGNAFAQLGAMQPALAAWWQARAIARRIGLPLAGQLEGLFLQFAQQVGAQDFAQIEAGLKDQAEEWRQAGVEAARQALAAA